MRMEALVATVSEFFLIRKDSMPEFGNNIDRYIIPKYQREYKWKDEKVTTLLSDIKNRDKFIGNLILNKVNDKYEIVDGQQRITSLMLMLIALYNKYASGDTPNAEQTNLLRYIYRNDDVVLKNESIGDYIHNIGNHITIDIRNIDDIYYQKDTFNNIYYVIEQEINNISSIEDTMSFQRKILDSQILILIGETQGRQNDSIEEVFLDINFKSQLLDTVDIFKGYCFKNFYSQNYDRLKCLWTSIRKYMKEFERIGYENTEETSHYIYHYLLSCKDSYNIPSKLSIRGKHYLEGKTNTQTEQLLQDMCDYGKSIIDFINKIENNTYGFDDICSNAQQYRTDIINHNIMRELFRQMILNTNVQYYKLPLFMVIHYLLKDNTLSSCLGYNDLKKFVTNYYAYSFFFICDESSKKKASIDHTIFNALYSESDSKQEIISKILSATKELRRETAKNYKQFSNFDMKKAYVLYSLMDSYNSANNNLGKIYMLPEYNKEHFLIHDNRNYNIDWQEQDNDFSFSLKDYVKKAKKYQKMTANYLVIPEGLNGSLGHKDIVTKITSIKEYYNNRGEEIPKHVHIFITYIEGMDEYTILSEYKGENREQQEIKNAYKEFIEQYFSEESIKELYGRLEEGIKQTLRNN